MANNLSGIVTATLFFCRCLQVPAWPLFQLHGIEDSGKSAGLLCMLRLTWIFER